MNVLLVLTAGRTDVQLVVGEARQQLKEKNCASLHDEIERRRGDWQLVDSPVSRQGEDAESLPRGPFALCTPKLDAVLHYMKESGIALTAALILETRRDAQAATQEPRFAGAILADRLRERGVADVQTVSYLTDKEHLEDREQPRDSVVRRAVVRRIDGAIRDRLEALNPAHVIIAATGGFPVVSNLVEEIVRLRSCGSAQVELLEVADGARAKPPTEDRAVPRHSTPEPAASYQARRHALELVYGGNLLGAWGAVQHLHSDDVEHRWTRVVEWLACFAASLPLPNDCDISVLTHYRMAVRAGLRVELALRAGDIPRAVHGTMAFFECALWDWLDAYDFQGEGITKLKVNEYLLPPQPSADQKRRFRKEKGGGTWHIDDYASGGGIDAWLLVLKKPGLSAFWQALTEDIRAMRNDVAHNEPTTGLMDDARRRMAAAQLWSNDNTSPTFLTQPLVQGVLRELGEQQPDRLCADLISTVRLRLLQTRAQ